MSVIQVTDLKKSYGGIRALAGCSMTFEDKAINGLIGPNGSGKTTLFNVITGYETADSGQVSLRGQDITNATPDQVFEQGIGRTFQITRIFPRLTVLENVHVAAQRQGFVAQARGWDSAAERERAMEVLEFVGLARLAPEIAGDLSYGQQKLLGVRLHHDGQALGHPARRAGRGVNPSLLRHISDRIRSAELRGRHLHHRRARHGIRDEAV